MKLLGCSCVSVCYNGGGRFKTLHRLEVAKSTKYCMADFAINNSKKPMSPKWQKSHLDSCSCRQNRKDLSQLWAWCFVDYKGWRTPEVPAVIKTEKSRTKQNIAAEKAKYIFTFTAIALIDVEVLNFCCSTNYATLKCWINFGMYQT